MAGTFTTATARNMFFGGTVFFLLLFLALTFQSERAIPKRDNRAALANPAVTAGKRVWETHQCIGCHTLLGEGAYFAPELGNVYKRRGGDFIKAWIKAQPTHVPGRRQMPQFNLSEEQLDELVAFFKYVSEINTSNWPPNDQG